MSHFIAGLLQGLFWFVALGLSLRIVRKVAPSLETPLFNVGVFEGIAILARSIRTRVESKVRRGQ